ncbi:PREDICTED: kinesin heavy chain-like [Priapulus caudatus]|uniref:Kinesin heavy chain-like n=1 Tax=Priapulus caudatus TaxID=37621 RepID=A0ABM1F615_PRICU|nr:PREDICTED: kinesin heavy chain-like [Priapulus caudatus]
MGDNVNSADECTIKVMCRVRPHNASEEKIGSKMIFKFPPKTEDTCTLAGRVYQFDKVLQPNITQEAVYNITAAAIVKGNRADA